MQAHGAHLATVAHQGRFWDVYIEFEDTQPAGRFTRGRLRFSAAAGHDAPEPAEVRTAYIFVEESPEAIVNRARSLHAEQVLGLLRSCLP